MKNQPSIRTSASHPLQIGTVSLPGGGAIGITFCPGKCGPSLSGFQWERDLDADLAVISDWGAQAVITLIEDAEFRMLAVPDLGARVRDLGMAWYHLPITDVQTPDERFEVLWQEHREALLGILRSGGRVLVHCRGGLGRAGTVAALMLVELGVAPAVAVRQVRAVRPGAIETRAQERYVMTLAQEGAGHGLV